MLITCVRQSAQKSKLSAIWKSFHCWFYQTKMFPQTAELAHADWKQKFKKNVFVAFKILIQRIIIFHFKPTVWKIHSLGKK